MRVQTLFEIMAAVTLKVNGHRSRHGDAGLAHFEVDADERRPQSRTPHEALCQRRVTAVYSGGYATLCYQRECSIGARRSPATAKIRVFIIPRTVGALALAILRARRSRLRLSAPPATVRRRYSVGVVAVAAPRGDSARLTEVVLIVRRSSGASKTPEDGTATGAGGDAARTPDRG